MVGLCKQPNAVFQKVFPLVAHGILYRLRWVGCARDETQNLIINNLRTVYVLLHVWASVRNV